MTGFFHWLYRFLRVIVRIELRLIFPVTKIEHPERLRATSPFILTSNHPNTLSDVFQAVAWMHPQLFFLANAGLFKNPILAKTLNKLYCIPVERPKDVGGKRIDNKEAFARSYAHLQRGGNIYIAPEGGSELERKLRPIKTGTARIALGTEAENDWSLGLRIIPVGINYEHPLRCLSRVLIRIGEPIPVANWRAAYAADPVQAAKNLTAELARHMQALLIQTEDKTEERLLTRLERSWQNDRPLPVTAHHYRTQQLLSDLRRLRDQQPAVYQELAAKTEKYRAQLAQRQLDDLALSRHPRARFRLGYLLGLPFFIYGWIQHFLPVYSLHYIDRALGLYRGYRLTVFMALGLITVPLFYALQTWLVAYLSPPPWAWLYLLSLPFFGIFTNWYARWAKPFWVRLAYRVFGKGDVELMALRGELMEYVGPLVR